MKEEQFELMYKFPGAQTHVSLPEALDHLYQTLQQLAIRCGDLESKNQQLEFRLGYLQNQLDTQTGRY